MLTHTRNLSRKLSFGRRTWFGNSVEHFSNFKCIAVKKEDVRKKEEGKNEKYIKKEEVFRKKEDVKKSKDVKE